ncbi:MAG TPA: hypothetical protein VIK07_05385 [Bacteroidales bacterium]
MTTVEKYDKVIIGLISGFILPLVVGITIFLFTHGHKTLSLYLSEIAQSNIITHAITLCVFPNIVIFLIFNRFDMLRCSKGVLAITIVWALIVFGVKFL